MKQYLKASYPELTQAEIEKVTQFNEDELMKEAVKKVLLKEVYGGTGTLHSKAPLHNWAILFAQQANEWGWDDEKLGNRVKLVSEAVQLFHKGFANIDEFVRDNEEDDKKTNEGK